MRTRRGLGLLLLKLVVLLVVGHNRLRLPLIFRLNWRGRLRRLILRGRVISRFFVIGKFRLFPRLKYPRVILLLFRLRLLTSRSRLRRVMRMMRLWFLLIFLLGLTLVLLWVRPVAQIVVNRRFPVIWFKFRLITRLRRRFSLVLGGRRLFSKFMILVFPGLLRWFLSVNTSRPIVLLLFRRRKVVMMRKLILKRVLGQRRVHVTVFPRNPLV